MADGHLTKKWVDERVDERPGKEFGCECDLELDVVAHCPTDDLASVGHKSKMQGLDTRRADLPMSQDPSF